MFVVQIKDNDEFKKKIKNLRAFSHHDEHRIKSEKKLAFSSSSARSSNCQSIQSKLPYLGQK